MTHKDDEKEEPLDPKIEHIRQRMIRLLVISIGIMMVGLVAVFVAIVYKINSDGETGEEPASVIPGEENTAGVSAPQATFAPSVDLTLPDGARVVRTSLNGTKLLVEVRLSDGGLQLWIVDMPTGETASRVNIR